MRSKVCFIVCLILLYSFFPRHSFAQVSIVLNEVMVHPSSGNPEWIEIYNPEHIGLGAYWIDDDVTFDDDAGGSAKKQLTTVSNNFYSVFELPSSMFNNDGDIIVLFDPNGFIVDQYSYTKDPGSDKTIGRSPDVAGTLQPLESATKGSINSSPQLLPTATPTRTPTPTKQPTPTKSPTTTKVPTATKKPSLIPSPTTILAKTIDSKSDELDQTGEIASNEVIPTSILGASISAIPTHTQKKEKKVIVKDAASKNPTLFIPLIVGGLFLLACGILIYRRWKEKEL
jgi:hypothetical protein